MKDFKKNIAVIAVSAAIVTSSASIAANNQTLKINVTGSNVGTGLLLEWDAPEGVATRYTVFCRPKVGDPKQTIANTTSLSYMVDNPSCEQYSVRAVALGPVSNYTVQSSDAGGGGSTGGDNLPQWSADNLSYAGSFRVAKAVSGEGDSAYSHGQITVNDGTLYLVGHPNQDAIFAHTMPSPVADVSNSDLPIAERSQPGAPVIERAPSGNPDGLDYITGMQIINGKFIVNAHNWYDAGGTATDTTLILDTPSNLAGSEVSGFFKLPGGPKSGGWITPVPAEWKSAIGSDYLAGYSMVTSIASRHSIGPSAHAVNSSDIFSATASNPSIKTDRLMEFDLSNPLSGDLNNTSGENDLWTMLSKAIYGFIVPGTSTYLTIGSSGGHRSGVGYKITQSDGNLCGGYCAFDASDYDNYYWAFDVNDLIDAKKGLVDPHAIRPYSYGILDMPEISNGGISGASFDSNTGTLYISESYADTTQSRYSFLPFIHAYKVNP